MAVVFADEIARRFQALCEAEFRVVVEIATDDTTGDPVASFLPPLTAEQSALLPDLLALARSRVSAFTLAEWQALKPKLAEMRTFRTRTAQEWSALTAAQRDNALIQWCQDITDVLRGILRD